MSTIHRLREGCRHDHVQAIPVYFNNPDQTIKVIWGVVTPELQ